VEWHQRCASVRYYSHHQGHNDHLSSSSLLGTEESYVGNRLEEEEQAQSDDDDTAHGLMHMRRVLVTPLRVLPYLATPEPSCRIMRQCVPILHSSVVTLGVFLTIQHADFSVKRTAALAKRDCMLLESFAFFLRKWSCRFKA
jgi:hypothetical protein